MSSTKTTQASKSKPKATKSSPAKPKVVKEKVVPKEVPKAEPVVEVEADEVESESESVSSSPAKVEKVKAKSAPKKKKGERTKAKRRVVTPDTIKAAFALIEKTIKDEIEKHKADGVKGVKFLRTLGKQIRGVSEDTARTLKKLSKKRRKKGDPSQRNVVSGFCKLCNITPELAKFVGCKSDEMKSRVDATRAIVAYVKKNGLQDTKTKKHINPDATLTKLLGFTGKNKEGEVEHLTYPLVQRYIQKHFVKAQ